nr:DUF4274 domain-containing protein [Tenacibaculum finnmarkense]
MTSNFDGNSFLCNWIKNNPKIDKAIILTVYWMSAPRWKKKFLNREDYLEKEGYDIENYDFVEEIEKKYIDGYYKGNEIIFDPKSDIEDYNWTSDYLDETVVREIPEIMFKQTEGNIELKEYPEDFDEGLPLKPIDYAQKVYDIFEEYEVE